ncbi:TetR/AcrR family transcriptional regulator [Pelobacter seleniigenes]|uniref:TetR/AcrR family transcriptional regulator n=1 Tax=Pelobacter seleniigenes TaxID=407188 RepID=UPI0004A76311|nr:CerR family C-terminal domain-containing protein [Pelobacter seleniigenes]
MAIYRSSLKTRKGLINAAGELAAEKGFHSVSTRAVAERAAQNIGSIHYHFGSKQKLFEAVVQQVAERWQQSPLEEALAGCDLLTRSGQAQALAIILRRQAELLFDKAAPAWHCRVIYQLMQSPDALQAVFRTAVVVPEREQVEKLLKQIDPDLTEQQIQAHFFVLTAPLLLHADYQKALLRRMGKAAYDDSYLETLLDICTRQTLLALGLPVLADEGLVTL